MIVVVGGGAVGLLLAATWVARAPVTVLVRTRGQAARISRCGIAVCGLARRTAGVRAAAADRGAHAILRAADAVVVCVKTYSTVAALRPLRAMIPRSCPVLTVQNGLHPERVAARALGRPVIRGIVTAGAFRLSPNRVCWAGRGEVVVPADCPGGLGVLSAVCDADVPLRPVEDFERRVWEKFAMNCVINPIGALADVPNGEIWRRPALRRMGLQVLREVREVFPQAESFPAPVGARLFREVCVRTASNSNSMLQDLRAGSRLTEIRDLNGAVVAAARRRRLSVPVNETLAALVAARAATVCSQRL
mgnify:CR=1 FL=1